MFEKKWAEMWAWKNNEKKKCSVQKGGQNPITLTNKKFLRKEKKNTKMEREKKFMKEKLKRKKLREKFFC